MLIAAARNKLTSHKKTRFVEDEITSTIFGPLTYFSSSEIWYFFETLIKYMLVDENLWPVRSSKQINVKFFFWPLMKTTNGEKIEPDVLVKFRVKKATILTILVEVKWDCLQSSQDQLAKQWDAIDSFERENCFHLYLVRRLKEAECEIKRMFERNSGVDLSKFRFNKRIWQQRLFCMSWEQLMYIAQENLLSGSLSLNKWASNIAAFLSKLSVPRIIGLKNIIQNNVPLLQEPNIFWGNFRNFEDPFINVNNYKEPLFFAES